MIRTRREPPKRRTLDDIFSEPDELGLLKVLPSRSSVPSADQRLIATLQSIESFVKQNGREPQEDAANLNEAAKAVSLAALRSDPAKVAGLAGWDTLGLLGASAETCDGDGPQPTERNGERNQLGDISPEATVPISLSKEQAKVSPDSVTSLDDIWASDSLGLLTGGDDSAEAIFDLTHVPEVNVRDMPDEIAQRTPCDDFYRFESLFDQVRKEIREGDAEAVPFEKESQIDKGDTFIVYGMMCLVDEIGENEDEQGRYNPRFARGVRQWYGVQSSIALIGSCPLQGRIGPPHSPPRQHL